MLSQYHIIVYVKTYIPIKYEVHKNILSTQDKILFISF